MKITKNCVGLLKKFFLKCVSKEITSQRAIPWRSIPRFKAPCWSRVRGSISSSAHKARAWWLTGLAIGVIDRGSNKGEPFILSHEIKTHKSYPVYQKQIGW